MFSHTTSTILAIDPGYDRLGWAIGKTTSTHGNISVISYGCIQTDSKQLIGQRFKDICEQLLTICKEYAPNVLVIEKLYFSKNTTTALRVSEAKGIIFATCMPYVSRIVEFDPNTLKLAVTGHGKADKAAVEKMTRLQLNLPTKPIIDDTMDALGLLLTYAVHHSHLQGTEKQVIL